MESMLVMANEEPIPFGKAIFVKGIKKLDQMGNTVELAEKHLH